MFVSGGLFLAGVIVDCLLLVRVRLEQCTVHISPLISLIIFLHVTHLGKFSQKASFSLWRRGRALLKPDVCCT